MNEDNLSTPAMLRKAADRLKQFHGARASLLASLDRSLALQALWPRAFDHGNARSYVTANVFTPAGARFVIENGAGERKEFPLCIVPRFLWANARSMMNTHARGRIAAWRD